MFDCRKGAEVVKYLFLYEIVVIRGKSDTEKAGELLCYLQAEAFDFYYGTYSRIGELTDEASEY